ncbi:MAG: hypothetical protein ABIQ16_00725 [Polyangiaceae bacterium]
MWPKSRSSVLRYAGMKVQVDAGSAQQGRLAAQNAGMPCKPGSNATAV